MKPRKTWAEKLADSKDLPKVVAIPEKMREKWGTGTLVVPAPHEVDEIMRNVPRGKLITINEIRVVLARKHGATIGCPITTGIFAWIAAHAAEESATKGKRRITPYWRTLKSRGMINEKYPGGAKGQIAKLRIEGHRVSRRGSKYAVEDFEESLVLKDPEEE
ncbi:MAG: MGMT family protein [Acidobacteriia bacterium]|nr:MGMT family protein [Terriglobia bacterium]